VRGVVGELALPPQDVLDLPVGVREGRADPVDLGDPGRMSVHADAGLGDVARAGREPFHRRREATRLDEGEPDRRADGDQRQHDHRQPHASHVVAALDRRRERDDPQRSGPGGLGAQRMAADRAACRDPPP